MQIIEILEITGIITVQTGLHIGGSKDDLEIGGLENSIIKTPDGKPYIPGSSLKGKMRSLLELCQPLGLDSILQLKKKNLHDHKTNDDQAKLCPICRIFGIGDAKQAENANIGAPRLIVRDAFLKPNDNDFDYTDLTELKYENTIDRITGTAENPRQIERVVLGTQFDFTLILKIYDIDTEVEILKTTVSNCLDSNCLDAEKLKKKYTEKIDPQESNKYEDKKYWMLAYIIEALNLLEYDALGGCGSRGCGKVSIFAEDGKLKITTGYLAPATTNNGSSEKQG